MSTISASTTSTTAYKVTADTTGTLVLQTGASPTTALTLSTSQNATFAGTVADSTGTLRPLVSGTAVASTSGTSIDFTGIPSWVKRLTIMFSGVSTSGSSNVQVQLGTSGGVVATGYLGSLDTSSTVVTAVAFTTGLGLERTGAGTSGSLRNGVITFVNLTSNTWAGSALIGYSNIGQMSFSATSIPLGGTLDRVRITTVNGTDTFDAGTINILYEG